MKELSPFFGPLGPSSISVLELDIAQASLQLSKEPRRTLNFFSSFLSYLLSWDYRSVLSLCSVYAEDRTQGFINVSCVPSLLSPSPSFSLTSLGQLCSSVRETEDYVVGREGAFE